jgi:PGF-CTERM protein
MRKRILVVAVVATLALVSVAGTAAAQNGTVSVDAQTTEGETAVIDSVDMEEDGAVAVYDEDSISEEPNSLLGYADVDEGTSSDVEVELDEGMEDHGFLHAVLYTETPPSDYDEDEDSLVTDENDEIAKDFFYAAVASDDLLTAAEQLESGREGLMDDLDSYAQINQQRRENAETISDLRQQIDDLEDTGGDEYEDDIEDLQDQVSDIEGENEDIEDQISSFESTLNELEELDTASGDGTDDGTETDGGDGTEDGGGDGNETDGGEGNSGETGDGAEDGGGEGLPGFTVLGALVALLSGGALLRRNRE